MTVSPKQSKKFSKHYVQHSVLPIKNKTRLLPKEAIKRAQIRFAIEYFSSKIQSGFHKYAFNFKAEGAREAYETDVNAGLVRVSRFITKTNFKEVIC